MSHTLHRRGSYESLAKDFVVLVRTAEGINKEGSKKQLEDFVRIAYKHNPVNLGNHAGNMYANPPETICCNIKDGRGSNVVFNTKEDLTAFIKELLSINYSLSVTCSGLEDVIMDMCRDCGIKPHSVNMSLGVSGNTSKLPKEDILEIITMCGHHQVSAYLVEDVVRKIKSGSLSIKDAALIIASPCPCGIMNVPRVEELLKKMT